MVASEAHPFSKTGGLADVTAALPKALGRLGHDVTLITPRYRGIEAGARVSSEAPPHGRALFDGEFSEQPLGPGARVLFLDCPPLYDRPGIYNEQGIDYRTTRCAIALLAAAAVDWLGRQPEPMHIVHAHDWQAGLRRRYLRGTLDPAEEAQHPARSPGPGHRVFTIHNLAYQGIFDTAWVPQLGLRWDDYTDGGVRVPRIAQLPQGRRSIRGHRHDGQPALREGDSAAGVRQRLRRHHAGARRRATGILNGIDTDEWNPAADPFLPVPYDARPPLGKGAAKRAVLERYGLPTDDQTLARPLIGMVSRMVDQKGSTDRRAGHRTAVSTPPSSCSAPANRATRTCGTGWRRGDPNDRRADRVRRGARAPDRGRR